MLKQDRTIIHVEIKETNEHLYFGSAAAMYEDPRTFRTKKVGPGRPYENKNLIVRKGELNTILHSR